MHASCESPWHSLATHCILDTCFLLTVPFRGMLLTPHGGPRCLAPTAHQIPVYLMVFSTFLCRAFTAHYLYTLRCYHIPPVCFTAQLLLEPAPDALSVGPPLRCEARGRQSGVTSGRAQTPASPSAGVLCAARCGTSSA